MLRIRYLFLFSLLCTLIIVTEKPIAVADIGKPYSLKNGYWYDKFGINRNYYAGSEGFLPKLADETLGQYVDTAYELGQRFQADYGSKTERAAAILKYVQRWTEYGYDEENVIMQGEAQPEWAWNADEMAQAFNEVTGEAAIGDCEDMAFLCGTIYVGAGIEAAIVDAPEHAALVIWLPEYSNANKYWDVPNDGRDAGWIWVEATGESNPLGWTPPDFDDGGWTAHPIGDLEFVPAEQPGSTDPTWSGDIGPIDIDFDLLLTVGFIILAVVLALLKSKR